MARKKIEPITSLGSEDKLTVQKSQPLFALWRSDLSLAEFKILDSYLSRIDSHKPERRVVQFERGELERLLGVKKINLPDLQERLKHLMGNVVEIPDSSFKKGFRLVSLFEEAIAEQDEAGLWQIKLECTQKAMRYFFNVEHLGYLRYKLRCITSLTSRYTYIMFLYLEANRYRKSWTVDLDELKQILDCDKEDTYKEFKRFNDRLLKRVYKEMREKTECRYSYTPIKKGRSVVAIHFEVETLPQIQVDDMPAHQLTLQELQTNVDQPLWACVLDDLGLSQVQLDELQSVLALVPQDRLPEAPACPGDVNMGRYHYIQLKLKALNRADAAKPIKNKYAYLLKMIQQDISSDPRQ